MKTIDLSGHSGCKIVLYEINDKEKFVRKISASKKYNKRLELQSKKQQNFENEYIKTPKILKEGYTEDELFYFDMEFIQGVTLSKYIESIEISKVKELVIKIINCIKNERVANSTVNDEIFKKKIQELREKLGDKNITITEAIDMLNNYSWTNFQKSYCHGDLTLENILIKNDELYLIDFLDSFYDCYILDISTILQDVELLWSYRYDNRMNMNTVLRLMAFRDILLDEIKSIDNFLYVDVYYALLLKLIRIFPYVKDDVTYNFLENKLKYVIDIIKNT